MPPCFKVNRQIRPVNSFFHKTRQKGGKVADATKGRSKRTFYTATATPKRRLFLFAIWPSFPADVSKYMVGKFLL